MGMTADSGGGLGWIEPQDVTKCKRDFQSQAAYLLEQAMTNPNLTGRVKFSTPFDGSSDQILDDLRGTGTLTKLHDLVHTFAGFGYRLKLEMEPME